MPPVDNVAKRLREDAAARTGGGTYLLLGGIGLSFVVVVVLAIAIDNLLSLTIGTSVVGWMGWTFLLMVGVAALVVKRVRTPIVIEPIDGLAVGEQRLKMLRQISTYTPGLAAEPITGIEAVDKLLLGPRLIINGVRQMQHGDDLLRERFFDRSALVLRQLASVGESVKIKWLLIGESEPVELVEQVITYLERYDWVGASSDRQRIWLSSQAKQVLPFMGVQIGSATEI